MVSVGTIVWLSSELMFFAALFAMYFTLRSVEPRALGRADRAQLNIPFATVNTIDPGAVVGDLPAGRVRRASAAQRPAACGCWYILTLPHGRVLRRRPGLRVRQPGPRGPDPLVLGLRLGLLPDHRLPRPARHRRPDRLPVRARPHVRRAALHPRAGDQRDRRVLLLALRRRRVDRACSPRSTSSSSRQRRLDDCRRDPHRRPPRGTRSRRSLLLLVALVGRRHAVRRGRGIAAPRRARRGAAEPDADRARARSSSSRAARPATASAPRAPTDGPTLDRRRRRRGRLPGRHRPHAAGRARRAGQARRRRMYTDEEIAALAAYVASLGPGPAIPTRRASSTPRNADLARGGELFRTNCAPVPQLRRRRAARSPRASTRPP